MDKPPHELGEGPLGDEVRSVPSHVTAYSAIRAARVDPVGRRADEGAWTVGTDEGFDPRQMDARLNGGSQSNAKEDDEERAVLPAVPLPT